MLHWRWIVAVALLAGIALSPRFAPAQQVGYFEMDNLFVHRTSGARDFTIMNKGALLTGSETVTPSLTTDELGFSHEYNFRVAAGFECFPGTITEASYWGTGFWYDDAPRTSTDFDLSAALDSTIVLSTLGFNNADYATATYTSRLHNAELNQMWNHSENFRVLLGMRYVNLYESFDLWMGQTGATPGTYHVRTDNNMLGFQVGGIYDLPATDRLSFHLIGKTGMLFNMMNRSGSMTDTVTLLLPSDDEFRATDTQPAFIAELGVQMRYQLGRYLWMRLGAQVMVLTETALAVNQFDRGGAATPVGVFHHEGTPVYDGAFFGFEYIP
ncbi:MAG: hypothetical protein N2C14_12990 [Planctomycetales bacterium]